MTNAVHGFLSMLTTVLRQYHPGSMAVAFDLPTPTFRDAIVPDYKGNRPDMPESLGPQFDLVRAVLDSLGICALHLEGFEADDILATLATRGRDAGLSVVVVSGDRDTFQLVEDPLVAVLYTRRGLSDTVRYDEAGIEERYGVPPSLYPLLAALRGDPSDNLAGVPGVGEKTAARLAAKYRSLDNLFEHVADQTPKLRQSLELHEHEVRRNAGVVPLVRDAPVDVALEDLALGRWDLRRAEQLFADLELRNSWQRLVPVLARFDQSVADDTVRKTGPGDAVTVLEPDRDTDVEPSSGSACRSSPSLDPPSAPLPAVVVPRSLHQAEELLRGLAAEAGLIAVAGAWSGEAGRSDLQGIALCGLAPTGNPHVDHQDADAPGQDADAPGEDAGVDHLDSEDRTMVWLPASLVKPSVDVPVVVGSPRAGSEHLPSRIPALVDALGPGGVGVVGHGLKELMRSLLPWGVDIAQVHMDTAVAAFLLDPGLGRSRPDQLLHRWLGGEPPAPDGQLSLVDGSGAAESDGASSSDTTLDDHPVATEGDLGVPAEAAAAIAAVIALIGPLRRELESEGMTVLNEEVEQPLVRVLARMEVAGVGVDIAELRRIADDMAEQGRQLQQEMHELAGEEFNVNSTPQLRRILYGKLGLTPGKKTKTGYSTDAQTLERLRGSHRIVDVLLHYREVEKLRSTYGESLLAEVGADGRIHATFQQTVARTGRLSSDHPNLHNIPVRTAQGMALRRAFVPMAGHQLLVADYDQIELRIIAHLASDPGLLEAFAGGRDVHRSVAARVFGVPEAQVTSAQRSRAKMVSYGLAYGMEAFGLGQRLGIATDEARQILDAYFVAFPGVQQYMDETVARARELGYTVTPLGRRRPLPDLNSANRGLRQAAERQAMNAPIQGMAADLFKMALVQLDQALQAQAPFARLVLQVHDEVLVEAMPAEAKDLEELVVGIMAGVGPAAGLTVPLEVSAAWGDSWGSAKR